MGDYRAIAAVARLRRLSTGMADAENRERRLLCCARRHSVAPDLEGPATQEQRIQLLQTLV